MSRQGNHYRRSAIASGQVADPLVLGDKYIPPSRRNRNPNPKLASDPDISREQKRSRRKRAVRCRTISTKRISKLEIELGRALYPDTNQWRPKTRAECGTERPCPHVLCRWHLYLDVSPKTGAIKMNVPDLEVWEMENSCVLDVADMCGTTLQECANVMNLTRERIRQIEVKALARLEALLEMQSLRVYADEGLIGKRKLPILEPVDEVLERPLALEGELGLDP